MDLFQNAAWEELDRDIPREVEQETSTSFRTMLRQARELERLAEAYPKEDYRSERTWHFRRECTVDQTRIGSPKTRRDTAWSFRNPSRGWIEMVSEFFWISKEDAKKELLRAAEKIDPIK